VSIWLWCSRCFVIPYCNNEHDFLSFYIVVSKEEWKKEALLCSAPGGTLTSQRHCSWACGSSLVQRVNLICAKKVYYSNRPEYVFLCFNGRITSNIFKTCFGQSEQVWMDEKLVTILLFEIQSRAFVFLNLWIYHLLTLNIWRIINQLLVVWGGK